MNLPYTVGAEPILGFYRNELAQMLEFKLSKWDIPPPYDLVLVDGFVGFDDLGIKAPPLESGQRYMTIVLGAVSQNPSYITLVMQDKKLISIPACRISPRRLETLEGWIKRNMTVTEMLVKKLASGSHDSKGA